MAMEGLTRSLSGTSRSSFDVSHEAPLRRTHSRSSLSSNSTWKRVTSLYSATPKRRAEEGPDEDMWDNNDAEFKRDLLLEAQHTGSDALESDAWNATSMEVVASPPERTVDLPSSDVDHIEGHSMPERLPSSTHIRSSSALASPVEAQNPGRLTPSKRSNTPVKEIQDRARPISAHGSLISIPCSYSTQWSDRIPSSSSTLSIGASSSNTSKAGSSSRRRRARTSDGNDATQKEQTIAVMFGGGFGSGTMPRAPAARIDYGDGDVSPTSMTFDQRAFPPPPHDGMAPLTTTATSTSAEPNARSMTASAPWQVGAWTQEPIDDPLPPSLAPSRLSMQDARAQNIPAVGVNTARSSRDVAPMETVTVAEARRRLPSLITSSSALNEAGTHHAPAAAATDYASPASSTRRRSSAVQSEASGRTIPWTRASLSATDGPSHPAPPHLPPKEQASIGSRRSSTTLSPSSSSQGGLLAGLRKRFSTRRKGATLPLDETSSSTAPGARYQSGPIDPHRRPSLPHVTTTPSHLDTRRLSMQHTNNHVLRAMSAIDPDGKGHIPPFQAIKGPRESPASLIAEEALARRTSTVPQTSSEQVTPRILPAGLHISATRPPTMLPYSDFMADDVREELQGDGGSSTAEEFDRASLSSVGSSSSMPLRPPRVEEGEVAPRRPSMGSMGRRKPSIESLFNAAHSRRWSTYGSSPHQAGSDRSSVRLSTDSATLWDPPGDRMAGEGWDAAAADTSEVDARPSPSTKRNLFGRTEDSRLSLAPTESKRDNRADNVPMRRSNVEPSGGRFSQLFRGGSGRKASGSGRVPDTKIISRPAPHISRNEFDGMGNASMESKGWTEIAPPLGARSIGSSAGSVREARSPATASCSGSSLNRNSAGSSLQPPAESHSQSQLNVSAQTNDGDRDATVADPSTLATDFRPSRSVNDLLSNRGSPWRNTSSANLSTLSTGSAPVRRPTFGLDLQPDAAAAFDSIPLPETPVRSRSRAGSINHSLFASPSSDQLSLPPPMVMSTGTHGSASGHSSHGAVSPADLVGTDRVKVHEVGEASPTALPAAAAPLSHQTMPMDLPSDVEDLDDLLFETGWQADKIPIDHDLPLVDVAGHDHAANGLAPPAIITGEPIPSPQMEELELLDDGEEGSMPLDSRARRASTPSSAFQRLSLDDDRSRAALLTTDKATRTFQYVGGNGSRTNVSTLPPPIVAAHLRRPASSSSFI